MAAALDVAVDYDPRLENDRELGDFNQGVKSSIHYSINQKTHQQHFDSFSLSFEKTQTYNWIKFKSNPFPRHNTTGQNIKPHPFLFFRFKEYRYVSEICTCSKVEAKGKKGKGKDSRRRIRDDTMDW